MFMKSPAPLVDKISKHREKPLYIRVMGGSTISKITIEGIISAAMHSSVPCPSNHCRGEIVPPPTGNIGKCSVAGCIERVNIRIAKKVLTEHIQVEKGLMLKVNMESIDDWFGKGVAKMYLDNTLSLSDKYLELVPIGTFKTQI